MLVNLIQVEKFNGFFRHFRLPDFISVTIPDAENSSNFKRLVVEIINDPIVKPFLGGYYNRLTGRLDNIILSLAAKEHKNLFPHRH